MNSTVVMTTYNGEKYILEMLQSILKQTRQPDEVLIFDDNSSDNTIKIVNDFISFHKLDNWKCIINPNNLGWENNFYQGIISAQSDVVFPADQDDIWKETKIEKMMEAFENNDRILLLSSNYEVLVEEGGELSAPSNIVTADDDYVSQIPFSTNFNVIRRPGCVMGINKKIIALFSELWKPGYPHDSLLWMLSSLLHGNYIIRDELIIYRRHSSNASFGISHNLNSKISDVKMVNHVNTWYEKSQFYSDEFSQEFENCKTLYKYRYELLINRKLRYWFKLFFVRKNYYGKRQYMGDLYYYFKSIKERGKKNGFIK